MVIYMMRILILVMMAKEDKDSFVWILFDLLNFSSIVPLMLSLADAWQSQSLKKHRKFGGSSRLNIPG